MPYASRDIHSLGVFALVVLVCFYKYAQENTVAIDLIAYNIHELLMIGGTTLD